MTDTTLNILFSAIASLAILFYLAPGVFRLGANARRWTERGAFGLIGLGLLAALAATLGWAFKG